MSVELSKTYAPTAAVVNGVHLGTYPSPFLAAAREEEALIAEGFTPDIAHRIVSDAHGGAKTAGVSLAKSGTPPQSGYTACACRDCMDTCVTASQGGWTLCWECLEAGCTPLPPASGEWPGRRPEGEYECQRDDAYGDSVGDAGAGHGSYEYRSGC